MRQQYYRWTWAEDEVGALIAAGWNRIGDDELRYTFNSAEGDEIGTDIFAAAYKRFEEWFETAIRLAPGQGRSAVWVRPRLLITLTSHHIGLIKQASEPRSENVDVGEREHGPEVACECHCHCEAQGLDYCNELYDCGDFDEDECDCAEEHDCEAEECDHEDCDPQRCGECHCCACWKNCGCDFYSTEECGCGCYECTCDCYSAILNSLVPIGDDEPVTVADRWSDFVAGLARALTRLGKGERIDLAAHGHRYASFAVRNHALECAIAGNRSVPAEYHLDANQHAWLIRRGWYEFHDHDRTSSVSFGSAYDEYVNAAESAVTVLRDFLGVAKPSDLVIETTSASDTPDGQLRRCLEITPATSPV
ncbi:hypothetical protein ABZ319_10010 [Nocardia sp. NPDC005978]|uniref:TY-Chap domain-containing protein n=1 Tax=Nocardia sp. NPDC005978 TaxID=3156725 RepID=UPI0033ACC897